jgi:outer membrane protein OmpA-like peptidoglycan-associated protein
MARKLIVTTTFLVAAVAVPVLFSACQVKINEPQTTASAEPPPPPPPPAPTPDPTPAPVAKPPMARAVRNIHIEGDKVSIPGELEFDVDKAIINDTKAPNKDILSTLKEFLDQNAQVTKLRIEGHTDNTGKKDHNQQLSDQRAAAVAKWLTDHGVAASRLHTIGFGDSKPSVPNDNDANRAKNRRTEFHIEELEGKPVPATPPPAASAATAAPTPSASAAAAASGIASAAKSATPAVSAAASAAPKK